MPDTTVKITAIETCTVNAGWKNRLLLKLHTDSGLHGIGEGTFNIFQDGWEKHLGQAAEPSNS